MSLGEDYIELQVTSNFSFLKGASFPEEYLSQSKTLGYQAVAITDQHTLAGVVRAHLSAKEQGVGLIIGTRLDLIAPNESSKDRSISVLVYPINLDSYAALSTLLTIGRLRTDKSGCLLTIEDFLIYQNEFVSIIIPPQPKRFKLQEYNHQAQDFLELAKLIKENSCDHKNLLSIALTRTFANNDQAHFEATIQIARYLDIALVATNDVCYHLPSRRPLQDLLTCIRLGCTIQQAGFSLLQNSDRYLKSPSEMARLFRFIPAAITRTKQLYQILSGFSLDQLKYEYPDETHPADISAIDYLSKLTWEGAQKRYPQGVPEEVCNLLSGELKLIEELSYQKYFLTCYDIVCFARSKGILCQGRGSAANSAVCYCLGITSVDPSQIKLLFARFISKARNEPPDIDIDFEHERREEVIQYIYNKYGRDRAALTAVVVTYRSRSAVRDAGKALGLSLEIVDRLAKSIHRWTGCTIDVSALKELGLDPNDPTILNTLVLSRELIGFPRHLSQHVGGFIISDKPLSNIVPILNASMKDRTTIEWNKDDIDALGIFKIDLLGLGMLSCIRKTFDLIEQSYPEQKRLSLSSIPNDDSCVFDMICGADTLGVFQIESRAQMSMLPRLKPRCFYDLVIEVAIVRPGPIQGNMVHPYLKRRNGLEKVAYPDKRVEEILGKTLGVPLFQEQAMRLAIVLAGFSDEEADRLRRAMAAWRRKDKEIAKFREKIIDGMQGKGYSIEFAETCIQQIQGFSEYGFPESHAASFALLAYASSWLKYYYPAHFAAALINSQPMGFYAPSQIVKDAERHGVSILPIDINFSRWECSVQKKNSFLSIRLGMSLVRGLSKIEADLVSNLINEKGQVSSIERLAIELKKKRAVISKKALKLLAKAGAFSSMGLGTRDALWQIAALPDTPKSFDLISDQKGTWNRSEDPVCLPNLTKQEIMFQDYQSTGLSLSAHPLEFIRAELNKLSVNTAASLNHESGIPEGSYVKAAGLAIVRQRPSTAKGVVFLTVEDETGIINLIVNPLVFEKYRKQILSSSTLLAAGKLSRIGNVIYLNVKYIQSLDSWITPSKETRLPNRSYSY